VGGEFFFQAVDECIIDGFLSMVYDSPDPIPLSIGNFFPPVQGLNGDNKILTSECDMTTLLSMRKYF
jgi:hypothetical protein